jgi:gamma-glutamyltranspeptidase/glutathione hydrolase
MAPTIVLRNGSPYLALGSPGGATIITTVLQILFDRLDEGWTLPQAIADPRASQRQRDEHRRRAGVPLEPTAHAAGGAGPPLHERGRDRRGDWDRVPRRRQRARAAEPVRRGTGSAMVDNPAP